MLSIRAFGQRDLSQVLFISDCGTLYTIPHGHANFTGGHTTYNHSVPIICNHGYVLHGDNFSTCLANGSWSEGTSCVSEGKCC